jgi:hypothetical protein
MPKKPTSTRYTKNAQKLLFKKSEHPFKRQNHTIQTSPAVTSTIPNHMLQTTRRTIVQIPRFPLSIFYKNAPFQPFKFPAQIA